MRIKKIAAVLALISLSTALLLTGTANIWAQTEQSTAEEAEESSSLVVTNEIPGWPQAAEIMATAGIVMEDSTGTILFNQNMDQELFPGSAVKIMTTLLALENSNLEDIVTMTATGVSGVTDGGVSISSQLGEEFTMEQCLYAIMLASANDVALQVAEHIGGSVEGFVEMMNQRAKELGCTGTVFTNPTGLPDPEQHTTAHDLALIMQAAIANTNFRTISTATAYSIPATNVSGGERVLTNNLELLDITSPNYYQGCLGGKAGFTSASGVTLVTAAEQDDMTLIAVVLQGGSNDTIAQGVQLLNYGFGNFSLKDLGRNDFDVVSGGIVLAPAGSSADSFTYEDTEGDETISRTYLFGDIPVGTAVVSYQTFDDTPVTIDGEANMAEAENFTAQKPVFPYIIIGAAGLLLLIFLFVKMVKIIRS